MRIFFVCGAALLVLSLVGAVLQSMASLVGGADSGILTSAYDVWYALWPGNLVVSKIRIERLLGAWAWDPVLVTVLAVPAWVSFGFPGALLMWLGWVTKPPRTEEEAELEDAVFLYDSLAAQAKAEAAEFAEFQRTVDAGEYDDVVGSTLRVVVPGTDAVDESDLPSIEIVEDGPTDGGTRDDVGPDDEEPGDDKPRP